MIFPYYIWYHVWYHIYKTMILRMISYMMVFLAFLARMISYQKLWYHTWYYSPCCDIMYDITKTIIKCLSCAIFIEYCLSSYTYPMKLVWIFLGAKSLWMAGLGHQKGNRRQTCYWLQCPKTAAELLFSQVCLIQLFVSIFVGACIECILYFFMLKFELTKNVWVLIIRS